MEGSRCDILASGFFGILLPEVLSKPATGLPAPYLDTAKLEAKRSLFFPQCFLLGSKEKFPKAPLAHSHHQYVFSFFESLESDLPSWSAHFPSKGNLTLDAVMILFGWDSGFTAERRAGLPIIP